MPSFSLYLSTRIVSSGNVPRSVIEEEQICERTSRDDIFELTHMIHQQRIRSVVSALTESFSTTHIKGGITRNSIRFGK